MSGTASLHLLVKGGSRERKVPEADTVTSWASELTVTCLSITVLHAGHLELQQVSTEPLVGG